MRQVIQLALSSFRGCRGRSPGAEPGIQLFLPPLQSASDARIQWGEPVVYILASKPHGTLYICVTSDLVKRIWEHRNDAVEGFTKRYEVHLLVYFERFLSMAEAIEREKELKKWRRDWKIALIEQSNPTWRDLWPDIESNGGG